MRKRKRLPIVALLATLAVAGYWLDPWATSYPPLGSITRVEIRDLNGKTLRVIDDPTEVQRLVEYVDDHRHGWGGSWVGVPVPQVTAEFYNGAEFQGHFGVGPGFFECQRVGDFASKNCTRRGGAAILGTGRAAGSPTPAVARPAEPVAAPDRQRVGAFQPHLFHCR